MDDPQLNMIQNNLGHIYIITGPSNKKYVGQTVCIRSGRIKHGYLENAKYYLNSQNNDESLNVQRLDGSGY